MIHALLILGEGTHNMRQRDPATCVAGRQPAAMTRRGDGGATALASDQSSEPRISINGVTKVYRTRRGNFTALDNVSLDVGAGEIVVLLGPSGCGKTTLLRCVAGLDRPDEGEINIRGELAFSSSRNIWLPPERRHLSMVFQSYALWPHM